MPTDFASVIGNVVGLIYDLLPVVAGLAALAFIWGLVKFIGKAGDVKSHVEGRRLMIWGVVALFVMASFAGIIGFFHGDIFGGSSYIGLPALPERH